MRVDNEQGIVNLCCVAVHLKETMPVNAATKFAIRTVLREAINKSKKNYKGNVNRLNCSFISPAAKHELSENPKAKLIAEHILPVSLALREFESLEPLTVDAVVEMVANYSLTALITHEEDQKLREAQLVKSMPENWDGKNIFARYQATGIDLLPTSMDENQVT